MYQGNKNLKNILSIHESKKKKSLNRQTTKISSTKDKK